MGSGKKKVTGIDSFDKGVVKRCVHNFHNTEKELPTVKGILKKLKSDIHFQGSATSGQTNPKRFRISVEKNREQQKASD